MVNTRYDVAKKFKDYWTLLNWKGEKDTEGVYFDKKYGYLIERTYIVRMEHNEPAPHVFFIPKLVEDEDDEVKAIFPYKNMETKIKKYNPLFTEEDLTEDGLNVFFDFEEKDDNTVSVVVDRADLCDLLQKVPVKRLRDRSYLYIKADLLNVYNLLLGYSKGEYFIREVRMDKPKGYGLDFVPFSTVVNANTLLHALSLFESCATVTLSEFSDRIVLTSEESESKVEAIISCPKKEIQEQIEEWVWNTNH